VPLCRCHANLCHVLLERAVTLAVVVSMVAEGGTRIPGNAAQREHS
jgi:hypothetical protein